MKLNIPCYYDILRTLQDYQSIQFDANNKDLNNQIVNVEMSFEEMCNKLSDNNYEMIDIYYATVVLIGRRYIKTNGKVNYPYLIKYHDLTVEGHAFLWSVDNVKI